MEEMQENKRFMVRQWEELRKAGGISFSIEQIKFGTIEQRNARTLSAMELPKLSALSQDKEE